MVYVIASVLDLVYPDNLVAELRPYLSGMKLMSLRERTLKLLFVITDLALVPSSYLQFGAPFLTLLGYAVIDVLFDGSTNRPGPYFISKNFNFLFCVGLKTPLSLDTILLSQWLITSQSAINDALSIFKTITCIQHPLYNVDAEYAALSKVNPNYLVLSPFEIHYPNAITTTAFVSCTPSKP